MVVGVESSIIFRVSSSRRHSETVNISGSHKARHLIGTALHLAVVERLLDGRDENEPPLSYGDLR